MKLGKFNKLKIAHEVDFGLYLTDGETNVLLPQKYVPDHHGEIIDVFLYTDSEDRIIATTLKPKIQLHECALLTIKEVNKIGAFADWGLEKDLLIPFQEQTEKVKINEQHLIYLYLDTKTNRLVGSTKIGKFLKKKQPYQVGQHVNLIIGRKTDLGYEAVINQSNLGLIYHNEIYQPLKTGDQISGYIKRLRPDGKIDLSLQKLGYSKIEEIELHILDVLKAKQGTLPLSDKSSPEEIKAVLNISKGNFKKAIGGLYKKELIEIKENSTILKRK